MIQTHLDYHIAQGTNPQRISITFHLLGGYLDPQGFSKALSNDVLGTLIDLVFHFEKRNMCHPISIQWKLGTCAITSLNTSHDSQTILGPIGRGLALDVSSGKVFLVKMSPEYLECDYIVPMYTLRYARLWFDQSRSLRLLHHHIDDVLFIAPFAFGPCPQTTFLLSLEQDPERLLEYSSTSPECEEKDEYCQQVIRTMCFIHQVSCLSVFGKVGQEKGITYQYENGGWKRIV
jgi:hypothetical protein